MFEDIQKHRQAVCENIEKSLQIGYTESDDFEKAHKVGDVHPNGKWVWTQLPSGKFDWRVIKVKPQANTGGGSGIMGKTAPKTAVQNNPSLSAKQQAIQQMVTQSQKTTPKSSVVEDFLKIKTNEISTLQKKAVDKGFSQMSGEIKINNKNTKIVVVVRENDNFFERKPNTYSIKIGTDEEYPHIQTISENRNITVDQINDAIKKWVKEKEK